MDLIELKREQQKLARKIVLADRCTTIKTIGGITCTVIDNNNILALVVVCAFPSFELKEKTSFILHDPLPYKPDYIAYREMPAMIEAYNLLEQEPDLVLVSGSGILHPRQCGIASHLGLALNIPTIGVTEFLSLGKVENGKIILDNQIAGFEIKTREYANPLYVSPGHHISLGSVLHLLPQTIKTPHKMPEPLHLAQKIARKKVKGLRGEKEQAPGGI